MALIDSRVKEGTLTLGTTPTELDFSCQITNVRVNSSYDDDGDAIETLCGDLTAAPRKLSGRSIAGTFVQDWTDATGISQFVWDHDLEIVAFEYVPNVADGPTIAGSLQLEVPGETYGGDVNTRITSDFEWQIQGEVTITPPALAARSATGSSSTQSTAA